MLAASLRRVAAPSVCFAAARILLAAAPTAPPCFRHWRRSSLLRIFLCFSHLRLRRRFYRSAELYALRGRNTCCEAANRRNEKKALSAATSFFPFRQPLWGLKGASSPFLATATTAACGGNREELLGPRSAGHECRPRHEVDAGYRNPSDPARRNRWRFSGSLLAAKENISA